MLLQHLKDYRIQASEIAKRALGLKQTPTLERQTGAGGWTFNVNGTHILKFAAQESDLENLEKMVALLSVLRPYLKEKTNIQVPDITSGYVSVGKNETLGKKEGEIKYAVYPLIQGEVLKVASFVAHDYEEKIMHQLGEFVGHLHTLPFPKNDSIHLSDMKTQLMEDLHFFVADLADERQPFKDKLLNGVYKEAFGKQDLVICHYDLSPRNICLDKKGKNIVGVIDFERAMLAPRSYELMNVNYDSDSLGAMNQGYQNVCGKSLLINKNQTPIADVMRVSEKLYEQLKNR